MEKIYDVLIIGGGVVGTGLLYTLAQYTNIERVALLEKYPQLAQVASHNKNNSQTLHMGDIETNYTYEKAAKVKAGAELVAAYVEKHAVNIHRNIPKMVIGVGTEEAQQIRQRYQQFKTLFPTIQLLERKELSIHEPHLVIGRPAEEELVALYNPEGHAIDFGRLSQSFVDKAVTTPEKEIDVFLNINVETITKHEEHYCITTDRENFLAKVVIVAAGSHSLGFAYQLGYGREYIILPVMGSFYTAHRQLHSKVYTLQLQGIPFAAVHGDPDVNNPIDTRFGPTAKVLPILERDRYRTVFDFFKLFEFRITAVFALLSIISDKKLFRYVLKNVGYDLPFFGKRQFLKDVQKIIPSLNVQDIHYAKRVGGIRPQLVNIKKKTLEFGEGKIIGKNVIFTLTPSPGASMCLQNALEDTENIVKFLGEEYTFDKKRFMKDHTR